MWVRYPTVHDPKEYIRETVRSTGKWYYGQYTDWAKSRFDTVLLRYGGDDEGGTMSNRHIARVLLIFSARSYWSDELFKLAFVQMFSMSPQADRWSGMFKVKKQDVFEVVEIDIIERGVHLIPCFTGLDLKMANQRSDPAVDVYTDFWLNNQIDMHMYNTIYGD